ncbi:outer membrane beta-barrel protein [Mucilaginibacter sp. UR6-11]|uniref:outer membrane beta-barrel protein n=1 Tax=Mucilaginibacter sp. UR6-11 TaxID=1435644 RepID=UPI001E4E3727|nr:outer membrane beta-barrel protein [Mucilaginibacter sp. UR6-11]MCC8426670.1 PorT family protein [Mucilaginibacter sp. UR6-11]
MIKRAIILLVFIGFTGRYATAQKITYGVKISGGFSYQQIHNPEILSASSIKTFNIKGIAQMPVKDGYWLEAGLGISGKGSVVFNDALTTTTHLTYLELPVNVLRKFTFTDLGVFYVGAGGYLATGLSGKLNYETPGSMSSDKIRFGKNDDATKFDTGLNFSSGFEFRNRVTFNMAFTLGLNNIASTTQQDTGTAVVRNREFAIGLGYLFK